MEQLLSLLALEIPDRSIPWAGIGAVLLGIGSALTGIAAVISARKKGENEAIPSTNSRTN